MMSQVSSRSAIDEGALQRFSASIFGGVITPGDDNYDASRALYNRAIDLQPALIAPCSDAADVISCVNFGRQNGVPVAVRGGGHNVAGFASGNGAMMIDLSPMRSVRVDPEARTAQVGGGCTWGRLDHASSAFGLATVGGTISTTGVAGLTLGGGLGYLSRRFGLACDNLLSADIVCADGSFCTVSADREPDLFWAIRGGGGNFGVVTSFEFRLHPIDTVYGGALFYPMELADDLMRLFRQAMDDSPEELSMFYLFSHMPDMPLVPDDLRGMVLPGLVFCHSGDLRDGEAAIGRLRELGPVLDTAGPTTYAALQTMFDPLMPPGLHHYWKGDFARRITDEMIPIYLKHGAALPTMQATIHVYPLNGAVQRVASGDTAFVHRDVGFASIIIGCTSEADRLPQVREWARDYWQDLHPHCGAGSSVNFLMDEGQERVAMAYGDNLPRLVDLKRRYDPNNLFRINQNIPPDLRLE